jgi:DNA (cytosine-5)-methyltransferase 1
MKEAGDILTSAFQQVMGKPDAQEWGVNLPVQIKENLDLLLSKIETDKSLIQVLITSLIKKIITPKQDIRLHMAKFDGGYSARVLDTKVTTPFFKNHFSKYANKETAFLTKATRAEIKWTLDEGQKLPLRSQKLVVPFLQLMDQIQRQTFDLNDCLGYMLANLYQLTSDNQRIIDETIDTANFSDVLTFDDVLSMLNRHFATKNGSRLPVIAIFAVYQQLTKNVVRFEDKVLQPLNVHTSSDKHGWGDVEIWNADNTPYEIVEVKHQIPIDRNLVFDVVKKSAHTGIRRYYILTTYHGSFTSPEEEIYIKRFARKILKDHGLEVFANGISQTLKYYLRFVDDYHQFLNDYTYALTTDAQRSTEVSDAHLLAWQTIVSDYMNDPA